MLGTQQHEYQLLFLFFAWKATAEEVAKLQLFSEK